MNPSLNPQTEAGKYNNAEIGIADAHGALDGARSILIERIGENAKLVRELREMLWATDKPGHANRRLKNDAWQSMEPRSGLGVNTPKVSCTLRLNGGFR